MKTLITSLTLSLLLLSAELQTSYDSDSEESWLNDLPNKKQCFAKSNSTQLPISLESRSIELERDLFELENYKKQPYKQYKQKSNKNSLSIFSEIELRYFSEQEKLITITIIEELIHQGIRFKLAKEKAKLVGDRVYQHLRNHSTNNLPKKRFKSADLNERLIKGDPDAINITIQKILKDLKKPFSLQQPNASCRKEDTSIATPNITKKDVSDSCSIDSNDWLNFL